MDYSEFANSLFDELRHSSNTLNDTLLDFSKGEVGVLGYLAFENNNVTSGHLSEKLNVSTARIASILNSLENKKYIKRKIDKNDKRKTLVVITKSGIELASRTKEDVINKIIMVINEIGYEDIKKYFELILKIKNVLNKQ